MKPVSKAQENVSGYLAIEMELSFQTHNAQRYVWGLVRGVLSLFRFNSVLLELYEAASRDDPYADWLLLLIHDALKQARQKLQRLEKQYREFIKTSKNHQRSIVMVEKSKMIRTRFGCPYSYMAADMIGDYDRALAQVLLAKITGLSLDKSYDELENTLAKLLKSVLNLPNRWKMTHVTRMDIKRNTDKAKEALSLMGKLPAKVLAAEFRAQYAPEIVKN